MSDKTFPLEVVLCWHMHQPQYKNLATQEFALPWTYLHGIKDYVDMAAHLEKYKKAKAVVNFAPILLEQILDYCDQIRGHFQKQTPIKDILLNCLATACPQTEQERLTIIKACLCANKVRLVQRYPAYEQLAFHANRILEVPDQLGYFNDEFFRDLVVWFHLAWMGETVKREHADVKALIAKARHYSPDDGKKLLAIVGEQMESIVPRYRELARQGKVELSFTPYAHPIVPLLLSIDSALEAMPNATIPGGDYPGGEERALWHVHKGMEVIEQHFGQKPAGCWPSEGGVSNATASLLASAGVRWMATGQQVLHNSLSKLHPSLDQVGLNRYVYQIGEQDIHCFFRDDGLSDLIGFTYADWHADDAVANLIHHLETIAATNPEQPNRILSIILDGENAWEYYPENGYYFLDALYSKLSQHPSLKLTTFSDYLNGKPAVRLLPSLVAGSWVYGTFSTWIGDPAKNRAWELLIAAKVAFDAFVKTKKPKNLEDILQQLAICEGSDWFWWFGDYNPAVAVKTFDQLYRTHLKNLYQLMGVSPPEILEQPISLGSEHSTAMGTMLKGTES